MLDKEFMYKLVKIHLKTGRKLSGLSKEYGVSVTSLKRYKDLYLEEAARNEKEQKMIDILEENQRLRAELEESKKENDFLKKAAAFFAKNQD